MSSGENDVLKDYSELITLKEKHSLLESYNEANSERYTILIVDASLEVHQEAYRVLEDYLFEGSRLNIITAFSAKEAKEIIKNIEVAVVFVDINLEEIDAGLEVIQFIRIGLNNRITRIVVRTEQSDQVHEELVISLYDINDYREKRELSPSKFLTLLTTTLRAYRDLVTLERSKNILEKIIESSRDVYLYRSREDYINTTVEEINEIFENAMNFNYDKFSGMICCKIGEEFIVKKATGEFKQNVNDKVSKIFSQEMIRVIEDALEVNGIAIIGNYYISCINTEGIESDLIVLKKNSQINDIDRDLLSIYFTNISIANDNIILKNEIESTQREIIFTLGGVVEARSKETGNHVRRVSEYSAFLAEKIGLPKSEVELIKKASPMHDIGKISIPDQVLNKPGRLTEDEFEIIKTHSQIGYDLLKHSNRDLMQCAAIISLQHHEKFNGKGYPNGLKGEEISIYGRISAVADVFDALGCERVYKKAWSIDKILNLFREERGEHFDPNLVDILLNHIGEFIKIKESYEDV